MLRILTLLRGEVLKAALISCGHNDGEVYFNRG
jgi:hypothetical protein